MARKDPFSFWDLWVEPRLAFQRVDQGPARFESLLLLSARKTHPVLHHRKGQLVEAISNLPWRSRGLFTPDQGACNGF